MDQLSFESFQKLDKAGALRTWLGDREYDKVSETLKNLSSLHELAEYREFEKELRDPALALRIRALLCDKHVDTLFAGKEQIFLDVRLQADDVFYNLEQDAEDWDRLHADNSAELASLRSKYALKPKDIRRKPKVRHRHFRDEAEDLKDELLKVLDELKNLGEVSAPFLQKVTPEEAPNYEEVITNPMDLSTMAQKVQENRYESKEAFQADIDLIAANCLQFNGPASYFTKYAGQLQATSRRLIQVASEGASNMKPQSEAQPSSSSSSSSEDEAVPAPAEDGAAFQDSSVKRSLWYEQWMKRTMMQRMQRLAERAAQRKLPFPERTAFVRTPQGMAAYLEASIRPPPPPPPHPPAAPLLAPPKATPTSPPFVTSAASSRAAAIAAASAAATAQAIQQRQASGGSAGPSGPSSKASLLKSLPGKGLNQKIFLPEVDFPADCVPALQWERAPGVLGRAAPEEKKKPRAEADAKSRPEEDAKSRPEEDRFSRRKLKAAVWSEEALVLKQKQVVAELLAGSGCEGVKASVLQVLAELLGCHLAKLGRALRTLQDRYARHCSQDELLAMALDNFGGSTLEELKAYTGLTPTPPSPSSPSLDLPQILLHAPLEPPRLMHAPQPKGRLLEDPSKMTPEQRMRMMGQGRGAQLEVPAGQRLLQGPAFNPGTFREVAPASEEAPGGNSRKRKAPGTAQARPRKGTLNPSPPISTPGGQPLLSPASPPATAIALPKSPQAKAYRPTLPGGLRSPPQRGVGYVGPTHAPPMAYALSQAATANQNLRAPSENEGQGRTSEQGG